ncbi:MAG: DUF6794 domain-containing protein [Chlorobiaceae bacterium]
MPDTSQWPRTIDDAVERIMSFMSEEEKNELRNTHEKELVNFHFGLGWIIRNKFGLHEGNDSLLKACARTRNNAFERLFFMNDPDEASGFIIEEVWRRLNSAF